MTDDLDADIARLLHRHHTRKAAGFYWFDTPASRRVRQSRQDAARAPQTTKRRPTWQTWNTRGMSKADELELILRFAHAGLDVSGVPQAQPCKVAA